MGILHVTGGTFRLALGDWVIHPEVILLGFLLLWGYTYAVTELRPKVSDAGRVRRSQMILFFLGVFSLYLAGSSPLDELSDWLVSAHMAQHVILTTVAPPLIIAGVPSWLWAWLVKVSRLEPLLRKALHPIVALALFNGIVLIFHLPFAVELQVRSDLFHFFAHLFLVVAGIVMWWPVLASLPSLPKLSYPLQMAYLFVQSLVPSFLASFLTFSDRLLYPTYPARGMLWGLSPVHDQQIGGLVMKLAPSIIMWAFIGWAFFRWYAEFEARERGPRWEEVETELRRLGLDE